ncbi:unnamed protein product [Ambrosiozyma monospora]|uniref:Unnamed protein product n=1 Tax=Ambrosiozyma monospora TaxID=43982 RepID=A0ACB5UBB3_AMBMO|nr:unnamed protein product [Ambrosiozyma monospora]
MVNLKVSGVVDCFVYVISKLDDVNSTVDALVLDADGVGAGDWDVVVVVVGKTAGTLDGVGGAGDEDFEVDDKKSNPNGSLAGAGAIGLDTGCG